MMFGRSVLAALLLSCLALPAWAGSKQNLGPPPAPVCEKTDMQIINWAHKVTGDSLIVRLITGPIVQAWMRLYNATPPVSDTKADSLLIMRAGPDYPAIYVGYIYKHCSVDAEQVSAQTFEAFLKAVKKSMGPET